MAEAKKAVAKAEVKAEPVKAATEAKKEEKAATGVKTEAKKAPVKKEVSAKKATAKKMPVKKVSVKKEAAPKKETVKKAEIKETVNFQFSGKSYTPDALLSICKDVWKYDLNGKEEDFKSVELYVKPEENTTYYVINGNITGSFFI